MRELLFEDGPLSDLVLSTFIARREALQTVAGLGLEIVGPRSSEATMRMLDFARSNRLPFTWHDEEPADGSRARRSCGCRVASELHAPSSGELSRALGIGRELAPARRSTCWWSAAARRGSARRSTAPRRGSRR